MIIPVRIFFKDLLELTQSKVLLLLIFVTPIVLVILIGDVRVRDPILRVAIYTAGMDERDLRHKRQKVKDLESLLSELTNVPSTA